MPRAHCCLPCLAKLACLPCCCCQQDELVAVPYELTSVQPAPEPGPTTIPKKRAPKPNSNTEEQHQNQNQNQHLTYEQTVAAVPKQQLQEQQKKQEKQEKQEQPYQETCLTLEAIVETVPRSSNGSESSLTAIEASVEPKNEDGDEQTKDDTQLLSAPPNLDSVQIPKDRLPDFSLTSRTRISYYGPPPFPPPLRPLPALPSHQRAYAIGQQNDKADGLNGNDQLSQFD